MLMNVPGVFSPVLLCLLNLAALVTDIIKDNLLLAC